jgi:hypothetical protein
MAGYVQNKSVSRLSRPSPGPDLATLRHNNNLLIDVEEYQIGLENIMDLFHKWALYAGILNRPANTNKIYKPKQTEWRVTLESSDNHIVVPLSLFM